MKKLAGLNLKTKISVVLFLLIFSFGLFWALIVPGNNEAPDEAAHLNMIGFLKTEKRIPVFNNEKKIIPTQYDPKLLSGAYYSMAYNSPVSYLPVLIFNTPSSLGKPAIIPMRLMSSLLLAGFAALLFLALCNLKPKSEKTALSITLFITLIPQLIFSAGYVNIEPIALFLSALVFYLYTRLKPEQLKTYLYFGLALGFLGLVKANYFIFIGFLGLLILFDLIRGEERLQKIKKFLWVLLIFLAINSWWWLRNLGLYHDPLILSYIKKEIIDKAPAWFKTMRGQGYNIFSIFTNRYFYRFTFLGFFANLGGANIFLPVYFYWLFYFFVLSLSALAFRTFKNNQKYLISFALIIALALLYFANKNLDDFSPQGRHLFPLIIPLAVVIFYGINNIKDKFQRWARLGLPIFSLLASLYGLFLIIDRYYVRGVAYVNDANKANFLASFSWRHPSLNAYSDLIGLMKFPVYGTYIIIVSALILTASLSYLCFITASKD